MIMPNTKTQQFSHCTPFSLYPSPSFLLSSFNLLLSLPVVQLSPIMALPCFSNRRLEINSTLVWPETLAELNMNDWDCSYTCCWERCMMALAGMGLCFSLLPRVNIHAVLCSSSSSPDHWATLSEISVQHCGDIVGVVLLSLALNSDQSDSIIW